MSAGLRVLQTRDPQGLTFSDVTDSLKDLREQKQKEAKARATQRLKDIEAVDNDLKTPYFRNQISKLTKEYQDYVQSPEYDPIKASQMKEVIINAKRNLGELDAYVAQSFPKDAGIYQERFNELFNGTIDYAPTPESLGEIKGFADYANIEPKDIIEVYNTDLKGVADGLLKAKETELGKSFNVSGKNFREVIQRLDPEDIDELAMVAASRPELQKYYESQLGRQVTAQELKDLAYNDLFKFTPLERKTRESGLKEDTDDDDTGWSNGRYSNKRYRLSPIEISEEGSGEYTATGTGIGGAIQKNKDKAFYGYDVTRITSGDPDPLQFTIGEGEESQPVVGKPNSVISENGKEYINVLTKADGLDKIVKVPLTEINKTRLFNYLDIDQQIHDDFMQGMGRRSDVGGKTGTPRKSVEDLVNIVIEED